MRATDAHPPASVVYAQVRRRLPRVSLGTVYGNLRRLAAEGLVPECAGPTGLRFDGNIAPRDHVTCVTCGRVLAQGTGATPRHPIRGVRFSLSLDAQRAFAHHEVTLVVDHPNEHARTVLAPETARSLAADLA